MNRDRRKEEVEKAYQIQVEAGLRGAAQYGAVGLGLAAIAHHSWPAFRCVRLPGCPRARRGHPHHHPRSPPIYHGAQQQAGVGASGGGCERDITHRQRCRIGTWARGSNQSVRSVGDS